QGIHGSSLFSSRKRSQHTLATMPRVSYCIHHLAAGPPRWSDGLALSGVGDRTAPLASRLGEQEPGAMRNRASSDRGRAFRRPTWPGSRSYCRPHRGVLTEISPYFKSAALHACTIRVMSPTLSRTGSFVRVMIDVNLQASAHDWYRAPPLHHTITVTAN